MVVDDMDNKNRSSTKQLFLKKRCLRHLLTFTQSDNSIFAET